MFILVCQFLAVYLIGFLPLAEERKRKAHIALIVLAVFLMVWGRTAFVRNFSLIPFSFFRYWVRAAFLLLLPISLGVGSYLADPKKIDAKAVLKVLVYPLLFFAVFSTLHYFGSRQEFLEICKIIVKRLLNIGIYNIFWCVIALASIFLLLFNGIKSKIKIYLLVVLILADIIFFGIISNDRLFVLKETLGFNDLRKGEINGRVLDLTTEINASNSLTASFWSIIGYSELVPINTIKKIEYLGLKSPRGAEFVNSCSRIRAYSRMIDLGISGFVDEDGVFVDLPGKMVEINGQVPVEMREGYVHIVKEASESIKVKTKINYYPGWLLYVDGKLKEGLIDTDTLGFINFEVHKYGSEIVLKFVPIHLYQGIFMSAIVLWFLLAYVYDFRKKLFGK
ncbi:MAG: hypothetical protein KatS3mg101_0702 [Patescibacteria group bacterium]|nr:MAG: hypothetical protein KatS3mg101_0702 [Patescibacteria group bacterium]